MKMMTWVLPAGISMLALGGCGSPEKRTTHWEKPGGTQQQLNVTHTACASESLARFPPDLRPVEISSGYHTKETTKCNRSLDGRSMTCTTTPAEYIPPTMMTGDVAYPSRNIDYKNCLIKNGWMEVYDKQP